MIVRVHSGCAHHGDDEYQRDRYDRHSESQRQEKRFHCHSRDYAH